MMNSILPMLQSLMSNPLQFIMQRRFNVPQNIVNDPSAVLNHLLSTGQVNQQRVNQAYQIAQRFR